MADEPQVVEPIVEPEVQPVSEPIVADDPRSPIVPRQRFDEVYNKSKEQEARIRELEAQVSNQPVIDPFSQPTYQQPQQPVYQTPVEADPYDGEAKKLGYQNWNQWAQYDMNGAMKGRQTVENSQRTMVELNQTQQRFAQKWFQEKPDLVDVNKRRADAEFNEFTRIVTDNPYYRISEKGLNDAKELAQLRVANRTKSQEADRLKQEGQKQEQDRMVQSNSATTPIGTSTIRPLGTVTTTIKLSTEEEKVRARMGVTAEKYREMQTQVNAQSGSPEKKYVATNYAKPQRPSLAQKV